MSHQINGKTKRVGLALSGGGFRAALYHIGILRQLNDWGLLWKTDVISSVSGGSITGAFLALHWGDIKALGKLETFLTSTSVANASFYSGILNPFKTATETLAEMFDEEVFNGATLNDLAQGPRSYIGTTNLATGNLFSFIAGGKRAVEMGEHELGFQTENAADFKLADAVAASSAFAPVFPPYRLNQDQYSSDMEFITLTDGGFYDNLAINPLLSRLNDLDYALISDAGKPFAVDETPTENNFMAVKRTLDILAEQVRGLNFDRLVARHKAKTGPKPIWFSIDNHKGCEHESDPILCSAVPSGLSKIDVDTASLLQRHSSQLLRYRFSQHAPELLPQ